MALIRCREIFRLSAQSANMVQTSDWTSYLYFHLNQQKISITGEIMSVEPGATSLNMRHIVRFVHKTHLRKDLRKYK